MNASHDFERVIYECECGAWWYGQTAATGCVRAKPEECPHCGEMVEPTVATIED